jgi:hypothetical protein
MMTNVGARSRGLERVVETLERQEALERNVVRTLEDHRGQLTRAMDDIDRELAAREDQLERASIALLSVSRNAAFRASDNRQSLERTLSEFDAKRYEPARERVREVAVRRRSIEALASRRARSEADRLTRSEQQRMDEAGIRTWYRNRRV